jgi:succinate-acetate transporter protein
MKIKILAIASTVIALVAAAQYSIDWSTIDGGGGIMFGGDYAIRGTIGQYDAGNMAGGDYVVHGGFWVPVAVQVADAPWLEIVSEGGTNVVVSWAPDAPGWVLQETFNLHSNWVDSVSGSLNPVSIPVAEAAMFYRLHQE